MVDKYPQQKIYPYLGSQNSTVHPVLINPKDIVFSDNIIYTLSNTKKNRPGLYRFFPNQKPSGSEAIVSGVDFHSWNATTFSFDQYFVYVQGTNVKAYNVANDTYTIIKSNIATGYQIVFEKFFGLLIMCVGDKRTVPQMWNGIGLMEDLYDDAIFDVHPTICRAFYNRLWIDDPAIPGRSYGSTTGDPTDWTTDVKEVDYNLTDGDPIGLSAFMPPKDGLMYVGKRHSLYSLNPTYVSGSIEFIPKEISTGADIGCISHNACVSAAGQIFFPSERGFHRLVSSDIILGIDTQFASAKIQYDWVNSISMEKAQLMHSEYDPEYNSIFVVYAKDQDTYANHLFGYSLTSEDWYHWESFGQSAVGRIVDAQKKRKTVFLSKFGDVGFLNSNKTSDYGQRFTMKIKSGIISPSGYPDGAYKFKFANFVFTPCSSGSFEFILRQNGRHIQTYTIPLVPSEDYNNLGDEFILGLSNLGGVPSVYSYPQELKGDGMFYDFLITFTPKADSENLDIIGILMDVDPIRKKNIGVGG